MSNSVLHPRPVYKQKLLDNNTQAQSNPVQQSTNSKPQGRQFVLESPDRLLLESCLPIMLIMALAPFALFAGAIIYLVEWIEDDFKDSSNGTSFAVLIFVDVVVCIVSGLCFGIFPFQRNAEKWLKNVMIINVDQQKFYFLDESTKGRWKSKGEYPFSSIKSIGHYWRTRSGRCGYSEDAYVTITLTTGKKLQFNRKSSGIQAVERFVGSVNLYLNAVQKERERKIRANNRKLVHDLVANGAVIIQAGADGNQVVAAANPVQREGAGLRYGGYNEQSRNVEAQQQYVQRNERMGNNGASIVDEVPADGNKKFVQCIKCDRYQFHRDGYGGKCVYCDEMLPIESKNEGVNDMKQNENENNDVVISMDDGRKKCMNCGEMIMDQYKFCDKCGTKVMVEEKVENKCVNCNESIDVKCKFCPNCGTMQSHGTVL